MLAAENSAPLDTITALAVGPEPRRFPAVIAVEAAIREGEILTEMREAGERHPGGQVDAFTNGTQRTLHDLVQEWYEANAPIANRPRHQSARG